MDARKEKNLAIVSFERLREVLKKRGIMQEKFSEEIGVPFRTVRMITCGYHLPDTELVAKMCMRLQCSANDIMELRGFEVKDRYKEHRTEFYPPVFGKLTYEPLRNLFKNNYGEEWEKKLSEMYDNIPVELTEKERRAYSENMRRMNPKAVKPSEEKGLRKRGRRHIKNDEPVRMSVLWGICSVLHCTPDYVIDYI